jgi:hypothetical protein
MINNKLTEYCPDGFGEEQISFLKGRSCDGDFVK